MALLQEWRDYAYKFDDRTAEGQQFWLNYFNIEKGIYEQLLADKDTVVSGTVKELADKYRQLKDQEIYISFEGISHILDEVEKARRRLIANVNFEVAIEMLLVTIKENGKVW